MKIIGVIPARYDSSRFPGKPLADICGKPMIWWVYHQAMKVEDFSEVIVATDSLDIEKVCRRYNMNVMMTSKECPTGTDRVGEVAKNTDGELYVNIQGDEPLIDPREIQELIDVFHDKEVYFASLRIKISDESEINALSTVKVVVDKNDDAMYLSRNVIPSNKKGGQIAQVFRHVGIYAYKKDFLLKFIQMNQTALEIGEGIEPLRAMENGYKFRVKETSYSSVGVDYPEHIKIVEDIMNGNIK